MMRQISCLMGIPIILLLISSAVVAQAQPDPNAHNINLNPSMTIQQGDMAADLQLYPTSTFYLGVKYKAALLEDHLPATGWVILFGESGFTHEGEYQPHLIDLMIKAGWADIYHNGLCAAGFPPAEKIYRNFTIQFGLSDYEDVSWAGGIQDNDIAALSHDPSLLPLKFTNIDSTSPDAPDKIMAEYQVDKGGFLEGREIEVSFVRAELTRLPKDGNYFIDPDNCCKPNSQADIVYRRWIARLVIPSLGVNTSVSFYINAEQGEYLTGQNILNFMWENPGRPAIETDRFKVIIYDTEVLTTSGEWKKATLFLADYRTPLEHLPMNEKGQLLAGYRKVNYKGIPAIEASFGYGYTDYVIDGNPTDYEKSLLTKGVIDLSTPWGEKNCEIIVLSNPGVEIYLDGELVGRSNSSGMLDIPSILPGYHEIMAVDRNSSLFSRQLVYLDQRERKTVDLVLVARTLPPGPFTLGDVSPITLKEGEEATLAFVVVNRGRGTAEGVTARIEAPGFQVISGLETIPNVPAGGSAKAVFRVRPLEGGVKNVKVTVTYTDSAGNSYSDVIESTVTVLARLVVSSSSVSGKPLEIPVTVN
ncbi:MAG: hypothetical protein ACP5KE_09690, partial [Candidatus Methanodesulfokora sp.]